ncbi:MAG: DM13 domain-containing protein [Limnospira sp.]
MKRLVLVGLGTLAIAFAGNLISSDRPTVALAPEYQIAAAMRSGTFVSGEHPTRGSVQVVEEGGRQYLEFADNFGTNEGPDLFVILHRSDDVIGTTQAPVHSINEGDYVLVEPLKVANGAQRYAVPAGIDVDDYGSVAIWCRQFNATFGAASLK